MNYTFGDYETAVLAALSPLKEPPGYLKTLQGYAGEFTEDAAMETFLRGFPGVLVEITEAVYERTPGYSRDRLHSQTATISLYAGARNWRSQAEARGSDTGIYAMLADFRRLLLGNNLGLEIYPLELNREMRLAADRQVVLYAAEYRLINPLIIKEV
jgi:hypothetical protein